MLLLLYFPFTAPLLDVVLTLLGEEKPLLIRLPSRSSCHFLFLSCLLQSSHWLLCFFFPFLPQSFCSPPAWVKPGVSFPHLPSVSRHVAFFDMWLPLPLLPPCVFLAWVWLFYQSWPRWLASSSGLEHNNVSLSYSISVQFSLLSSTFLFFFSVSCKIWHILNFFSSSLSSSSPTAPLQFASKRVIPEIPKCCLPLQSQLWSRSCSTLCQQTEREAAINGSECCAGCVGSLWYSSLFSLQFERNAKGVDTWFFCIFLSVIFYHFGALSISLFILSPVSETSCRDINPQPLPSPCGD